jgi:hypothetical protein
MMGSLLEKAGHPRPKKVFIFGELKVKTKNSPSGSVSWWYHVAPIIGVGKDSYVLDPAIDSGKPQPLVDWIKTMVKDSKEARLAVCAEHSYVPSSSCEEAKAEAEARAQDDQLDYLAEEWRRVKELGLDPEKVLGDVPPWAKGK